MIERKGIGVSNGYSKAKAFVLKKAKVEFEHRYVSDVNAEMDRLSAAIDETAKQIELLKEESLQRIGEKNAEIFDAHLMMLGDDTYKDRIKYFICDERKDAVYAVDMTKNELKKTFEAIDDEYMRARAADICDISDRLMRNLMGEKDVDISSIKEPSIIIAHDLTPSDTARIGNAPVIGFATEIGGKTSHSAIMAAAMNIPAVVALGDGFIDEVKNGDLVLIDGREGNIYINPSEEVEKAFDEKKDRYEKEVKRLASYKEKLGETKDGKRVVIEGNIGTPQDVDKVIENGGEGVGLFRSEFLFMDKTTLPTEEEQFEAYKSVVEKMKDKPVIIRTLDIGGDKNVPALNLPKEENPFLGYRAIRICLHRPHFFKVQARALLRASAYGNLKVMFPMISALEEVKAAKNIFEEAKDELREKKIKFDENIQIGIMIEIPAAAVSASVLAKYVDFFSIGTNDLIQYSCAVDRINEKISNLYKPLHPSVLKLIKMVGDAAAMHNIECGVCGEMGGSRGMSAILVGLGVTNLSMSASKMLRTKDFLSKFTYDECKKIADIMTNAESAEENEKYFNEKLKPLTEF